MQKKHDLWRYQNESDEARRLQSSGNSRRVRKELDLQHPTSSESCLEPPRKSGMKREVEKQEDCMEAGAKGETEAPETAIVAD